MIREFKQLSCKSEFEILIQKGHSAEEIGFKLPKDDVYRFTNRFRLAKEFEEIKFANYISETSSGYNSIFRIFLAYTAFELFLKIIGKDRKTVFDLIEPYNPSKKVSYILEQDKPRKLYRFLDSHLLERDKPKLKQVYDGTSLNLIYVASSIRHIFAHGHLSAYSNQFEPEKLKNVSDCLFDFLMKFMDDEFSKIINTFKDNSR